MLIKILGSIISPIIWFFKKLFNNWDTTRKIIVVIIFVVMFGYKISTPATISQLTETLETSIIQHKEKATTYQESENSEQAILELRTATKLILSEKKLDKIEIDPNLQLEVCIQFSQLFFTTKSGTTLSPLDTSTLNLIIECLNNTKKYFPTNPQLRNAIYQMNSLLQ